MGDPYTLLAAELVGDGIRCQFQTRGQLVISRQVGPIWPDQGNSFWVTRAGDRWYLFTWSPVGYRVPESADMAEVCRQCIAYGNSAMFKVPPQLIQVFGLEELAGDEADVVYHEVDNG